MIVSPLPLYTPPPSLSVELALIVTLVKFATPKLLTAATIVSRDVPGDRRARNGQSIRRAVDHPAAVSAAVGRNRRVRNVGCAIVGDPAAVTNAAGPVARHGACRQVERRTEADPGAAPVTGGKTASDRQGVQVNRATGDLEDAAIVRRCWCSRWHW